MNDGRWRGHQAPACDQRISMERQVVLGHLLPGVHAAVDWQDTVRAQRALERMAKPGDRPFRSALAALVHAGARWWQGRHGNQEPIHPATHLCAEACRPEAAL